jgi:unsaturated chondroitin disaccharide hydrolase
MRIDPDIEPAELKSQVQRVFELSAQKIFVIDRSWDPLKGAPVFTSDGKYTSRGWTEWTQGFQFGAAILQFDATDDRALLALGRKRTVEIMAPHLTHFGVHDHGFNNVSTYGNLLRLMHEGRIEQDRWEKAFYELALKVSGAVQASRWSPIAPAGGFIYSFNGPHSLFVDTVRTLRALALSYRLGHILLDENDRRVSLLDRLIWHGQATARYSVYYGKQRDIFDVRGRVAHESIFNAKDGNYRCPGSQQGYSPFTTWTRGLAWAMCGFSEQLEFLTSAPDEALSVHGGREQVVSEFRKAAEATCDFYIENSARDGITYWDTGAPGLANMPNWRDENAIPRNAWEPVDSSAAVIAAQGLLRLGRILENPRYWRAGLSVARTLFSEPYLSVDSDHQGLILHSVYHRPNGWDDIPQSSSVPHGESSMWGDYHALELALYLQRVIEGKPYLTFWGACE